MPSATPLLDRISTRLVRHFPGPRLPIGGPKPIVTITFDDVPETALSAGARILDARGVKGTFYVAGGLAEASPEMGFLPLPGLRDLHAAGHEIGSHTYLHHSVRRMSSRSLAADLDRNDRFLAQIAPGFVARNFAFPYAVPAPQARGELARRFRSSRGGQPGINVGEIDRGYLRSVEMRRATPQAELTGWVDATVAQRGWLILFTHHVSPTGDVYGCTPDALDGIVSYALDHGCDVLTIDAALQRLGAADAIDAARQSLAG